MNKGLQDLADNWEEWNEQINSGNLDEQSKAISASKDAIQDILNIDEKDFENLSPDFVVKNWDKITDVMNNAEGALDDLQRAAAEDLMMNFKL